MVSENDAEKEILQVSMGTRKYRVMIVDDELDITAIVKLGLEQNEFIVRHLIILTRLFQNSDLDCMIL
jgi:hypothetical protein